MGWVLIFRPFLDLTFLLPLFDLGNMGQIRLNELSPTDGGVYTRLPPKPLKLMLLSSIVTFDD